MIDEKLDRVAKRGWLDVKVDPTIDIFAEIQKLKNEKNAIILAHYYQDADIQGALNAGMDTIFVNHIHADFSITPTHTIYHLKELESIL